MYINIPLLTLRGYGHFRLRVFMRRRARHDLFRELDVTLCPTRSRIVNQCRLTVAGRLGEADVPRDSGLAELVAEMLLQLRSDLLRQVGALVEHGENHTLDH